MIFCPSSSSPTSPSELKTPPPPPVPRISGQLEGQQKPADQDGLGGGGPQRVRRSVLSSSGPNPISFSNPLEFSEDDDDSSTPSVRVHIVKNLDLRRWKRSQGPDAILTRHPLAPNVLMLHHRYPRESGGGGGPSGAVAPTPPSKGAKGRSLKIGGAVGRQSQGGGGAGGGGGGALGNTEKPYVVTPVLPINGDKKYNDTDCLPWEEVAILLRSSMHPKFKRQYIDPRSCNLKTGLECLPFEEKGAIVHRCRCMLVYGPKAVYTNFTDNTGRSKLRCFIPAGLGWDSECNFKSWSNYGYPLPFGDPSGTNAEQAAQTDAFNKGDGEQIIVEYIRWNSIVPQCVPGGECRERGTYTGQRCQCKKGHFLEKPKGLCNGGWGRVKGEWGRLVRWGMVGVGILMIWEKD